MMPEKEETLIFLEHVRLLRIGAVRQCLTKGDTLAIFEPYGARYEGRFDPAEVDRALARWRRDLKNVQVHRLTHFDYFDEMIEAGEEAVRFLEDWPERFSQTPVYRGLVRLVGSERVALGLKKGLVVHLKDRIHFFKVAESLRRSYGQRLIVVKAYPDPLGLEERFDHLGDLPKRLARAVERWVWMEEVLAQIKWLFIALGGLFVRLNSKTFKAWTPLRVTIPEPVSVDWARPLNRVIVENPVERKVRASSDDLEDEGAFHPSRWLYELSIWRFDKASVNRWRAFLQNNGAQFVDALVLRMPLRFWLTVKIPAGWIRIAWTVRSLCGLGSAGLLAIAYSLCEAYVEAHLFLLYFRPRVYLTTDDYLSGHVIRTIVFNRFGCKTIGVQHGSYSSLGLNPYLAFSYCDTYCLYGPAYPDRIWKGSWSSCPKLALIGVQRNDYTYRAIRSEPRRKEFRQKYSGVRVLLWCPPSAVASMLNRPELIEDQFRALLDFQTVHPDWTVVLHCRPMERAIYRARLERVPNPVRIVMEDQFSTYELIAYADGIVASNLSTVGIEAICAGRERVLFVNYWGEWNHPFLRYSPDLVVSNPKDLAAKLEAWAAGGSGPGPAALEAFRRDFDVGFDGRSQERFKAEMRALAGKVTS